MVVDKLPTKIDGYAGKMWYNMIMLIMCWEDVEMKEYRIGDHGLIHFNSISNAGKVFDHNHRHGIDK